MTRLIIFGVFCLIGVWLTMYALLTMPPIYGLIGVAIILAISGASLFWRLRHKDYHRQR
jgi:hypothetical protein